jgi:transposase
MERFVLTDAQWAKMEPHCLGKPTDPGRSGSDNRRFVEAVLWIARTGSPWRDLPLFFGNWNSVFKRYRDWLAFSSDCSRPAQTSRIWNTPWSMPPSSKSIATVRAQKGDAEPGALHWGCGVPTRLE